MTNEELFEVLKLHIKKGDCLTNEVSNILSVYKNSGGGQETAKELAEELARIFSDDEDLLERAYDVYDIVTGWCPSGLRVWDKKITEPLQDGLRFEDEDTGVVFNHFSFCEFIKHIMVAYAQMSYEQAHEKVKESFLAYVPHTLRHVMFYTGELDYHWAMLLAHGDMYWTKGIPSDCNGFTEEFLRWSAEIRNKHNLKEPYHYYNKK